MQGFPGFPAGKLATIALPELVFSDLLPMIDNLVELKVTLHCLWLLAHKSGEVQYVTAGELEEDEILVRGLAAALAPSREQEDLGRMERESARRALQEGLERATARGTLLQVTVHRPNRPDEVWYLANSERGRSAMDRIQRGEWVPQGTEGAVHLEARRPNIFNLYEQNMGLIRSRLLAEELMDAEETYPAEWIEEAFRIAAANNVRRWVYVRRILERWDQDGRDQDGEAREQSENRPSQYADLIKH
jgi:DNA replication protein